MRLVVRSGDPVTEFFRPTLGVAVRTRNNGDRREGADGGRAPRLLM
jgi:hypothetical protein